MNMLRFLDLVPDPWRPGFLYALSTMSIVALASLSMKAGSGSFILIFISWIVVLSAAIAWYDHNEEQGQIPPRKLIALLVGFIAAGIGLVLGKAPMIDWIVVVLLAVLIATSAFTKSSIRKWIVPVLWGGVFIVSAMIIKHTAWGGFPSAMAVLFSMVLFITKDIERNFSAKAPEGSHFSVHTIYYRRLSWVSVILFIFGVISLWPWLGELYNFNYFWILVLGVLTPIMYLWGRLRQPRKEDSFTALCRFNRVIPYVGFVLLLAIALG